MFITAFFPPDKLFPSPGSTNLLKKCHWRPRFPGGLRLVGDSLGHPQWHTAAGRGTGDPMLGLEGLGWISRGCSFWALAPRSGPAPSASPGSLVGRPSRSTHTPRTWTCLCTDSLEDPKHMNIQEHVRRKPLNIQVHSWLCLWGWEQPPCFIFSSGPRWDQPWEGSKNEQAAVQTSAPPLRTIVSALSRAWQIQSQKLPTLSSLAPRQISQHPPWYHVYGVRGLPSTDLLQTQHLTNSSTKELRAPRREHVFSWGFWGSSHKWPPPTLSITEDFCIKFKQPDSFLYSTLWFTYVCFITKTFALPSLQVQIGGSPTYSFPSMHSYTWPTPLKFWMETVPPRLS